MGGRYRRACVCVCARGGGGAPGLSSRKCRVRHLSWPALLPGGGGGGLLGAVGPSGRAGEPYTKAAGGNCGSDDLRLPPAHD